MPGASNLLPVGVIATAAPPMLEGAARTASSASLARAPGAANPSVTLNLSPDALSLLARAGGLPLPGVSGSAAASFSGASGLASQLVGAAVLSAVLDSAGSSDDKQNKQKRSDALASALVAAAAVSAYRQITNLPGLPVVMPVVGAGVSIAITGGA